METMIKYSHKTKSDNHVIYSFTEKMNSNDNPLVDILKDTFGDEVNIEQGIVFVICNN